MGLPLQLDSEFVAPARGCCRIPRGTGWLDTPRRRESLSDFVVVVPWRPEGPGQLAKLNFSLIGSLPIP